MCKFQRQSKFSKTKKNLLITAAFHLFGCTTMQVTENGNEIEENDSQVIAADPYEGFNRTMYDFNDSLDSYIFGPVVDGYKWVTPDILETGISNVFMNMKGINVFLNDFLQGKLQQGAQDTGRFLLNSTVGLGGIFDVATYAGLEPNDEDFGQTLAVWGIPKGPYLVLPVLGPSTFRGIPGVVIDTAANPISYLAWPVAAPIAAMAGIDKRATADSSLQFIDDAAVDRYVFTRESYLQHREYLATDGEQEFSDNDLLEDFDDEEGEDLLSGSSDLNVTDINKDEQQQSLDIAAETEGKLKQSQASQDSSGEVKTENADSVQSEKNSPAFKEAVRSFNKATRTYQEASDKLETIKKGDQL